MRRFVKRLRKDSRGTALMEFALVAPSFLLMLMGIFDISYRAYAVSVLQGAVQKAGRDSTLEGASGGLGSIDATITNQMRAVTSGVTMSFDRKAFVSFTRAGQAEEFEDRNDPITGIPNGRRDAGECYFDENGNGTYDLNAGINGQGGARDIVVYTVTATYPRVFPMYALFGFSPNETIRASTVLRNQPYGQQAVRANPRICL